MTDKRYLQQLKSRDPEARRQAVIQLTKSLDPDIIPILTKVAENDTDETVRQLARKGRRYIKKQSIKQSVPVAPPSKTKSTNKLLPESPQPEITEQDQQKAQKLVEEAVRLLLMNDNRRAAQELKRALAVDPTLCNDKRVGELAAEIMDEPAQIAIEQLASKKKQLPKNKKKPVSIGQIIRVIMLFISLGLLGVLTYWFVESGQLEELRVAQMVQNWEASRYTYLGHEYYVIVPEGEPPSGGYPMILALHGFGGNGNHMLTYFGPRVNQDQFILIAPTFGEYGNPFDVHVIPVLEGIMDNVRRDFRDAPLASNEVTIYGFSAGAGVSCLYTLTNPNQVAAQVIEGAPVLWIPESSSGGYAPTVVLYGENDGNRQYTVQQVEQLLHIGYLQDHKIISNVGHSITQTGIDSAIRMAKQYGR